MLGDWLRHPEVTAWWPDPDRQIVSIREDLDNPAMTQWIAQAGDGPTAIPLGYAQHYPAHHWPAPHFADLPADAIALDVFGAPTGFGRGGVWLRALSDTLIRSATCLAIDPSPENRRAIRAYEKAGFRGIRNATDSAGAQVWVMTRLR